MTKTRRGWEEVLPTTKPGHFLVVAVYYHLGGMNFFSGEQEPRGYYISAKPEERADRMRKFTAFSGTKALLFEVRRKSPKAEAYALSVAPTRRDQLIRHVLAKNKIELRDDGPVAIPGETGTPEAQERL